MNPLSHRHDRSPEDPFARLLLGLATTSSVRRQITERLAGAGFTIDFNALGMGGTGASWLVRRCPDEARRDEHGSLAQACLQARILGVGAEVGGRIGKRWRRQRDRADSQMLRLALDLAACPRVATPSDAAVQQARTKKAESTDGLEQVRHRILSQALAGLASRLQPEGLDAAVAGVEDLARQAHALEHDRLELTRRLKAFGLAPGQPTSDPISTPLTSSSANQVAAQCRRLAQVQAEDARVAQHTERQLTATLARMAVDHPLLTVRDGGRSRAPHLVVPHQVEAHLARAVEWCQGGKAQTTPGSLVGYLLRSRTAGGVGEAMARRFGDAPKTYADHSGHVALLERSATRARVEPVAKPNRKRGRKSRPQPVDRGARRAECRKERAARWQAQEPMSADAVRRWIHPGRHKSDSWDRKTDAWKFRRLEKVMALRDKRLARAWSDLKHGLDAKTIAPFNVGTFAVAFDPLDGRAIRPDANPESRVIFASKQVRLGSADEVFASMSDVRAAGGVYPKDDVTCAPEGGIRDTHISIVQSWSDKIGTSEITDEQMVWSTKFLMALLRIDPDQQRVMTARHTPDEDQPNPHTHTLISRIREDGTIWSMDCADLARVLHIAGQLQSMLFQHAHGIDSPIAPFHPIVDTQYKHNCAYHADKRVFIEQCPLGSIFDVHEDEDGVRNVEVVENFENIFSRGNLLRALRAAGLPPENGVPPGGFIKVAHDGYVSLATPPKDKRYADQVEYHLKAKRRG